ncbi:hypothetical protein Aduo_008357 [Ancylostoma duodenale]
MTFAWGWPTARATTPSAPSFVLPNSTPPFHLSQAIPPPGLAVFEGRMILFAHNLSCTQELLQPFVCSRTG